MVSLLKAGKGQLRIMGEVEWANTDKSELEVKCKNCKTNWKSPVKIVDGKIILKKPCPECGWNYTTDFNTIEQNG